MPTEERQAVGFVVKAHGAGLLGQDMKSPEFATQANNTVVGAAGAVTILAATRAMRERRARRDFSGRVLRGKIYENA